MSEHLYLKIDGFRPGVIALFFHVEYANLQYGTRKINFKLSLCTSLNSYVVTTPVKSFKVSRAILIAYLVLISFYLL